MDEDITASPATEEPAQKRRQVVWIATTALIVAFAVLRTLPWNVRVIPVPEDDSWDLALNYFASHHAKCGVDYVFTFGPLGFIYNGTYYPDTFNVKLWLQGLMCSLTMIVLVLQGKRLFANATWTSLWIFAILAWYGFFADVMFLSVPLLLLNQYFLLDRNLDTEKKPPTPTALILVLLLATTAIVKFTFFVASVWTITFIAIDELFVKRTRPFHAALFAILVPTLWLLSGQPIDTLFNYIATSLQVTSGHSEAMSFVENPNWLLPVGVAAASALALFISFSKMSFDRVKLKFVPSLLALAGLLFLIFKAAYVRHTHDHEPIASSVYGFAALALIPFILKTEGDKLAKWFGIGAIFCMTIFALPMSLPVDAPVITRYPLLLTSNILSIFQKASPCIAYLSGTSDLNKKHEQRMAEIRNDNQLPAIETSTDIYPVMCKVPIAYKQNYKPRPVFQSYLAYRQPLVELNEKHLQSSNSADTIVVQKLNDCYGYYPTLYDGPSLVALLSRYEPQSCQPAGLVLTKRKTAREFELIPLSTTRAKLGEAIPLGEATARDASNNKIVFARVNLDLTPIGKLQKLFFRIYPPTIETDLADGSKKTFIAPSEIMKSGFILSPFTETPEQFEKLYGNETSSSLALKTLKLSEKNDFPWSTFVADYSVELFELRLN